MKAILPRAELRMPSSEICYLLEKSKPEVVPSAA